MILEDNGSTVRICDHKNLFPLYPKEWLGTFVFAGFMLIANVAGIGGGGIAIPLAIYFFNFAFKKAIAVSSFSIMMTTMARFIYNFNERHPEKPNCTSIDYNMTTVMMPLNLVGSLIGAYVFKTFPDLFIMSILTLLLMLLAWESTKKFITMRRKENEEAAKIK